MPTKWFPWILLLMMASLELPAAADASLFARSNLVAWCIVPFDAKKRGPEERAQMLERLNLRRLAYDYRAEHIPTFDEEVLACKRHGIEFTAWWFPPVLNDEARHILSVIERHRIHPQLWVMQAGEAPKESTQAQRIEIEVKRLKPLAAEAARLGCKVGLYNHEGWFGEPDNQIAIIQALAMTNVGIVYNFHHGHDHIARFPELFKKMQPHLLTVNLNGMVLNGDKSGKKILHLGEGDQELSMLKVIRDSGWEGAVGIIDHRPETDSEETLTQNLRGLDRLLRELHSAPAGSVKPVKLSENSTATNATLNSSTKDYWEIENAEHRNKLPLYKSIPRAGPNELTPAMEWPGSNGYRTWERSHGNAYGTRFSSLSQIDRANVKKLQVAWTWHSKDGPANVQCNPIIVGKVMFAPTSGRSLVAFDAELGQELWRFKPELPQNRRQEDIPARRGLLHWSGNSKHTARIFFTCGDWLYALNPKSGEPIRNFGKDGRAQIPTGGTVAGAVFEETLVLPGFQRDVFGFHAGTGEILWRFHTVPHPGELGSETWDQLEEGANCWGGMALDEKRGIAYITTGSPKPNFSGVGHHGDNLFANCVLALDARNGKRLWHFQEIRHDIWDLDIPAAPNLLSVTHRGQQVDVVAAVTKLGNTLLLDRVTGKPLFPFRLRRAPTSKLPGEVTAPYQPDLELPEPFARQSFSKNDVTTRSEEARDYILQRIATANYGWFEPFEEGRPTVLYGFHGGAEWTGAAVDPTRGLLYVSANELPWILTVFRNDEPRRDSSLPPTAGEKVYQQGCANCHGADRVGVGMAPPLIGLRHRMKEDQVKALLKTGRNLMPAAMLSENDQKELLDFLYLRDRTFAESGTRSPRPLYTHNGYPKLLDLEGYPGCKPPWGTLNCLDLNTGKLRWKVPLGEYPELTAAGIAKTGTENFGGPIVTAGGLVLCAGTRDEMIRAFDADSGEELWKHKLPFGGFAPPSTCEVNGRQFIIIAATGGGKLGTKTGDAYVAFALPK